MEKQFSREDVLAARFVQRVDSGIEEIITAGEGELYQRGKKLLETARLVRGETHIQTMWVGHQLPAGAALMPDGWSGTEQQLTMWTLAAK